MLRLNLGACSREFDGFLSVDLNPPADVVTDLNAPWPWGDSTVDEVMAIDIFEHLADKEHTMEELWRVLKPGGRAIIEIPNAARGAGAWQDPTHVSAWCGNSFEYYEVGNGNRERFGHKPAFRILSGEHRKYDGKFDEVWKFTVVLEAVK